MSVFVEQYTPAKTGRGVGLFGAESFGRADPAGLLEHGFMDVTPQVHDYLRSQGKDAEFTPIYYNPQTKQYGVFQGRGLFNIQSTPRITPIDNGSSNVFGQILEGLNNLKFPLAVFTAGGTFALGEGAAAALPATTDEAITAEAISADATSETITNVEAKNVLDLSPDLLDVGGEGINIFDLNSADQTFPGWTTNPSISDLENGGEGAGLPGGVSNTASFPSLNTIATGAKTALELYTASRVADARVAQARASNAPAPVSTTPNFRSFLSNPAQGLGNLFGPSGASGAGASNLSALVIAGVIIIFAFLFLKR